MIKRMERVDNGMRIVAQGTERIRVVARRTGLSLENARLYAREHSLAEIEAQLKWYAAHQSYLDRVATRATPYMHLIVEAIEERGMPMEIALLPMIESAYNPVAYSRSHASGIWQFIPSTGKDFGLRQNWWYDGRRDVVDSTQAALEYLGYLHDHFDGDWRSLASQIRSGRNLPRAGQGKRHITAQAQ